MLLLPRYHNVLVEERGRGVGGSPMIRRNQQRNIRSPNTQVAPSISTPHLPTRIIFKTLTTKHEYLTSLLSGCDHIETGIGNRPGDSNHIARLV